MRCATASCASRGQHRVGTPSPTARAPPARSGDPAHVRERRSRALSPATWSEAFSRAEPHFLGEVALLDWCPSPGAASARCHAHILLSIPPCVGLFAQGGSAADNPAVGRCVACDRHLNGKVRKGCSEHHLACYWLHDTRVNTSEAVLCNACYCVTTNALEPNAPHAVDRLRERVGEGDVVCDRVRSSACLPCVRHPAVRVILSLAGSPLLLPPTPRRYLEGIYLHGKHWQGRELKAVGSGSSSRGVE
jgi:hypothetical protein